MFQRTSIADAKKRFNEVIIIAGWVNRTRDLSQIRFIVLRDRTGEIQVVAKKKDHESLFTLDIGREDVLKVKGRTLKSKVSKDGVEFLPTSIEIINKSKQPLPLDIAQHVKAELDTRLNYRFLDFRTQKTKAIFFIQNRLLTSFREYLIKEGYIEFQPPCIIASASEGGADLFSLPFGLHHVIF